MTGNQGRLSVSKAATHAAGAREGPIVIAGCWAHICRKFADAEPDQPQANAMLELIGELYAIERRATSEAELAELRRTESADVLRRIKAWLESVSVVSSTSLGVATKPTLKVWPSLRVFIYDPKVWNNNNTTERGPRGPVAGRRNHFGSKSRLGTEVAANLGMGRRSAKATAASTRASAPVRSSFVIAHESEIRRTRRP